MDSFARYVESPDTLSQTHPISRFAGSTTKRPKQGPSATKTVHFEVNLDENDEGELEDGPSGTGGSESEVEEEGEPDEFFDVLDILDGRADLLSDEEPPTAPSREEQTSRASSDGDEEEEEADDDGDDQDMDHEPGDQLIPSDDEADIGALQNLGQFISNLDSSAKRKASEDQDAAVAEEMRPARNGSCSKSATKQAQKTSSQLQVSLSLIYVAFHFILIIAPHRSY
jgi:U3 small nucleolar RNA-associated protein 14